MMKWNLMGIMSVVGALVVTARLNAATVAAGNGYELEVIASCIIGGTSPSGGIEPEQQHRTAELARYVAVYGKRYGTSYRSLD